MKRKPLHERLRWNTYGNELTVSRGRVRVSIYSTSRGYTVVLGLGFTAKAKTLDAAKRKAVQLAQAAIRRAAKAWEVSE